MTDDRNAPDGRNRESLAQQMGRWALASPDRKHLLPEPKDQKERKA